MQTRNRATSSTVVLTTETLTLVPSEADEDDDDDDDDNEDGKDHKKENDTNDDDEDDAEENRRWTEQIFGGDSATLLLESSDDDEYYAAREAEDAAEAAEEVVVAPISRRGGRKLLPGLPDLASTTAPVAVQEEARKKRTLAYQKQYREKLQDGEIDPNVEITGNQSKTLRTMSEVKNDRLEKGQVFTDKDYLLLRVKEEANLRGITIKMAKSDATKFVAYSEDVLDFYVQATIAFKTGCTVKHAIVRPMDVDHSWNGVIPGVKIHPIHKAEEEAAEAAAAAAKAAVTSSPQPPKKRGRGKAGKSKGKAETVKDDDTPFAIVSKYKSAVSTSAATVGGVLPTQQQNRNPQHKERWPLHTSIMT